jgi:hypothetical protein
LKRSLHWLYRQLFLSYILFRSGRSKYNAAMIETAASPRMAKKKAEKKLYVVAMKGQIAVFQTSRQDHAAAQGLRAFGGVAEELSGFKTEEQNVGAIVGLAHAYEARPEDVEKAIREYKRKKRG